MEYCTTVTPPLFKGGRAKRGGIFASVKVEIPRPALRCGAAPFTKGAYFIKALSFFLFFLLTSTAFAQSAANQLSGLLENLHTFQADFSQAVRDKSGNTLSESSGTMALKRPGLFRWETAKPNQQLIIADGKTLWIYDKDLAQITRQKKNALANTPGLLLSDSVSRLVSRFRIILPAENTFKLIPKGRKELFQFVELIFDNQVLKQMRLHDNLGQVTDITFNHAVVNHFLPEELFQFQRPASVEITER